jgi:hypothetical protein
MGRDSFLLQTEQALSSLPSAEQVAFVFTAQLPKEQVCSVGLVVCAELPELPAGLVAFVASVASAASVVSFVSVEPVVSVESTTPVVSVVLPEVSWESAGLPQPNIVRQYSIVRIKQSFFMILPLFI